MRRRVVTIVTLCLAVLMIGYLGYHIYKKRYSALTDSSNYATATVGIKVTESGTSGLGYLSATFEGGKVGSSSSQDGYFLLKVSAPLLSSDSGSIILTSLTYHSFVTGAPYNIPITGGSDILGTHLKNGERLELIANIDAEGKVALTQWSAGKPDDVTNSGLRTLDITSH